MKEGWIRSRERTEPPMYPAQNRLFQDSSRFFFLRREYCTSSTGYEDVEFGLGGHKVIFGGTVALVRRALESLYVALGGAAGMTATDKKHSSCLDN